MASEVRLSSPWMTYLHKMEALFGEDPEIKITFDEDELVLRLLVDNNAKADALAQLLPSEHEVGNLVIKIVVIPANVDSPSRISLVKTAFMDNPALSRIVSAEGVFTNPIHYVVFKNKVVQYFNDNLADVYGNCSTLYQDLAAELIGGAEGICYCTDVPEN